MKILQILNDIVHWQPPMQTMDEIRRLYAPDMVFVEAPDHVFPGWGYMDGEFIKPTAPDGWVYDDATGTFYPETIESMYPEIQIEDLKRQLEASDYKITKCAEYQLSGLVLPYDIEELHAHRQTLRDKIEELEA